jgi:hypothetical protein
VDDTAISDLVVTAELEKTVLPRGCGCLEPLKGEIGFSVPFYLRAATSDRTHRLRRIDQGRFDAVLEQSWLWCASASSLEQNRRALATIESMQRTVLVD